MMLCGDCQPRHAAEVVCMSPTYIQCSASTSSGSLRPQGDGSDEELLCGAILCRVTPDSHMRMSLIKVVFIVACGVGQLPLTVISLATHLAVLSFRKVRPPNGVGSPLPSGR
ncbi:hypothetical protein FKM82_027033 [Ascaphus truei]